MNECLHILACQLLAATNCPRALQKGCPMYATGSFMTTNYSIKEALSYHRSGIRVGRHRDTVPFPRFKGLDLIEECLKNYGWRFVTLYRRQRSRPFPRKRNAKRQNGCLRRP